MLSAYAQPRETSTCTWHWSGEAAASHLPDSEKISNLYRLLLLMQENPNLSVSI